MENYRMISKAFLTWKYELGNKVCLGGATLRVVSKPIASWNTIHGLL